MADPPRRTRVTGERATAVRTATSLLLVVLLVLIIGAAALQLGLAGS